MLKVLTLFVLLYVTSGGSTDQFDGIAGCRTTKLDLVFVVDGSTPSFLHDFRYVRLWIQNITSHFDVSPYTTRVAIVQNGETPYISFGFDVYDSTDQVLNAVNNIQFGPGTSTTGDILRFLKSNLINKARDDASVMVLVLSDGRIQERDDIYWSARRFHDMGITTFAIGAGDGVSDDQNKQYLESVASDPVEDHLFMVQDLRDIGMLERGIIKELCKHTVQECPTASHDLAFIIDGSSTIGYKNFEKVKSWMKKIVEAFEVGVENTRIAVIQYSTNVQEEISFNDNLTKSEVLSRIDEMSLLIGDTHTGHALEYCMKVIFSETYGARNNVPDVVIVMTDGKAQDHHHVVHAANLVHDAGIEVYAMGIGDRYSLEEINDIASAPDENHVILANGFDQIDLQRIGLIKRICVESEPGCPNTAAEIVFLVDNQMTKNRDDFHNVKTFLKNTVDYLEVGPHYSRISVVRYAGVSDVLFDLSTYSTTSDVINAISRQVTYKSSTNDQSSSTGRAIDYVESVLFSHVRENVPKFLVIVTNGNSRDNFVPAVKRAQKAGIVIFSVGVGDAELNNLGRLASVPEHVFHDETFDGMRKKSGDFMSAICAVSEPTCSVQEIDLQFLVDGSNNITPDDFEKVKRWIRNVIRSFDIGNYTTRVGLTQYSSSIQNEFDMNTYKTRREIEHAVQLIELMGGNSNTGSSLEYVKEHSFTASAGSRDGAAKVLIVISDGNSEDSITESIKQIHDAGIRVFAVGAGRDTERKFLNTLATEPIVTHVTESSSFDAINTVRQGIVDEICRETKSECPEAEMDLIFLLDGTTTADAESLQLVKEWLVAFVNQFEIGEHNSKIGLIQYADRPRLEINLKNVSDKETLTDALIAFEPLTGVSNTGAALKYVKEQGFSDIAGERQNTPKVVIVLTNGESRDPVTEPAQRLRDDGVIMYSVGVGKTDKEELRSIASSVDNILHVRNYDAIQTIHSSLVRRVCQTVQIECRENTTDVVLLIDGSYSVGHKDWEVVKAFMRNITEKFSIGPDDVQVGVVQFGSTPRIEFNLKDHADSSSLRRAIRNIKWMRGETHLTDALRFTRQHALTSKAGVRGENAAKILIIVTDGDPQDNDDAHAAAYAIRSDGWRVFAIGVGEATLPELHILASKPVGDHVFHADNFESTRKLKGRLFRMICTEYDASLYNDTFVTNDVKGSNPNKSKRFRNNNKRGNNDDTDVSVRGKNRGDLPSNLDDSDSGRRNKNNKDEDGPDGLDSRNKNNKDEDGLGGLDSRNKNNKDEDGLDGLDSRHKILGDDDSNSPSNLDDSSNVWNSRKSTNRDGDDSNFFDSIDLQNKAVNRGTSELKEQIVNAHRDNETGIITISPDNINTYDVDVRKHRKSEKDANRDKQKKNKKDKAGPSIADDLTDENCPKLSLQNGKISRGWDFLRELGINFRHKKAQKKVSVKPKRSTLFTRYSLSQSRLKAVKTKPGSSEDDISFRISSNLRLFGPLDPRMENFFDDSWRIIAIFRMQGTTPDTQWTLINMTDELEKSVFSIAFNGADQSVVVDIISAEGIKHIKMKTPVVQKLFDRNFHKLEIVAKGSHVAVKVDCVTVTKRSFEPHGTLSPLLLGNLVTSSVDGDEKVIVDVQRITFECAHHKHEDCCDVQSGVCARQNKTYIDKHPHPNNKSKGDEDISIVDLLPTAKTMEKCVCPPGPRGPPGFSGTFAKRSTGEKPSGNSAPLTPPLSKTTVRHIAKKVATAVIQTEIKKMYKTILSSITEDGRIDPLIIKAALSRYGENVVPDTEILKKSAIKSRMPGANVEGVH